jgi:hypothetical protein
VRRPAERALARRHPDLRDRGALGELFRVSELGLSMGLSRREE